MGFVPVFICSDPVDGDVHMLRRKLRNVPSIAPPLKPPLAAVRQIVWQTLTKATAAACNSNLPSLRRLADQTLQNNTRPKLIRYQRYQSTRAKSKQFARLRQELRVLAASRRLRPFTPFLRLQKPTKCFRRPYRSLGALCAANCPC